MNLFFGFNNNIFKSELQIPIFKNRYLEKSDMRLFKCYPSNRCWNLEEITNRKANDFFLFLKMKI